MRCRSMMAGGVLLLGLTAHGEDNPYMKRHDPAAIDGNAIFQRMGRARVGGGFRDPDYWVWGSSIIKSDDGKFHMYVSRWPKGVKFPIRIENGEVLPGLPG